jgi:hypothetical protein
MSSGEDLMFGCGGFGLVEMQDEDGNPTFGFYLTEMPGPDGETAYGLQLGCCNETTGCWVAHIEVDYQRDNSEIATIGERLVAIKPCSGHCRIIGPYENDSVSPIPYVPPVSAPIESQSFTWVSTGALDVELEHRLNSSSVVAIVTGAPGIEFGCRVLSNEKVKVSVVGSSFPAGTTVSIELRRGIDEFRSFTWQGDGLTANRTFAHNFNSRDITVSVFMLSVPDAINNPPPNQEAPALMTFQSAIVDYNNVNVAALGMGVSAGLEVGYNLRIEVRHIRPILPEEEAARLRTSHTQFTWGGSHNLSNCGWTGGTEYNGIQLLGVYFGQRGWYNPELNGRYARIMMFDGSLVGMTYGSNSLSNDRGPHGPVLSWGAVTECMWDTGADPVTGEWPLDQDGEMLPDVRPEMPYDRDYFFTLPAVAWPTPRCSVVYAGLEPDLIGTGFHDLVVTTSLYWNKPDENIWHGRANFEYKAATDADSWLRSSGPTVIIGGSVYKLDAEMSNYLAEDGAGWRSIADNAPAANPTPVPPLPASKILLPTFPNGLPDVEEEPVTSSDDYVEWLNTGEVAPKPPPTAMDDDPKYHCKYPVDGDPVNDQVRAFWDAVGFTTSPWYRHPAYSPPDILSEEADDGISLKPFYDAAGLGNGGFNTNVVGMRLVEWSACGPAHMCARGLFPLFEWQRPMDVNCYTTSPDKLVVGVTLDFGNVRSIELYRWPYPLIPNLYIFSSLPSTMSARWVGAGDESFYDFEHGLNTLTPVVNLIPSGTSYEILYSVVDVNTITVYAVDPIQGGVSVNLEAGAIVIIDVSVA